MATANSEQQVRDKASQAVEMNAPVEDINALTKGGPGTIETQEATEIEQDVPVGSEFDTDLEGMAEEEAPVENPNAEEEATNNLFQFVEGGSMLSSFDPDTALSEYLQSNKTRPETDSYTKELSMFRMLASNEQQDFNEVLQRSYQDVVSSSDPQFLIESEKSLLRPNIEKEYYENYLPNAAASDGDQPFMGLDQYVNDKINKMADFGGMESVFTDALAGASVSEREEVSDEIVRASFSRLEELARDNGTLDTAGDYVANFITDLDFFLSDIGITNIDTLVEQIDEYQRLDVYQQYGISEELVNQIYETSDGNYQNAAQLLALYNDPDFKDALVERAAWNSVELAGWGIVSGGMKAGKTLLKARNPKQSMTELDNAAAAARMNAAQGADATGDLNRVLGQDAVDVALEAHPASEGVRGLKPNVVNGMADEIALQKEAQSNALKRLEDLSNRKKLSLDESAKALDEAQDLELRLPVLRQQKSDLAKSLAGKSKDEMLVIQNSIDNLSRQIKNSQDTIRRRRKAVERSVEAKKAEMRVAQVNAGKVPKAYQQLVDEEVGALVRQKLASMQFRPIQSVAKDKVKPTAKPGSPKADPVAAADMAARNAKNQALSGALGRVTRAMAENQKMGPQLVEGAARNKAEELAIDRLRKQVTSEGSEIQSITKKRSTRDGVELEYTTGKGTETRTVKFIQDDLGGFSMQNMSSKQALVSSFMKYIASPDALIGRISDSFKALAIEGSSLAGAQSSRFLRQLQKGAKDVTKDLSKKEKADMDALLTMGDEEEKVFSLAELMTGVESVAGQVRPNQKTIDSYYAMRELYDTTHGFLDYSVRRAMELEGYKVTSYLSNGKLQEVVGKVYDDTRGLGIKGDEKVRVVTDEGTFVTPYSRFSQNPNAKGYQPVRVAQRQTIATDGNNTPVDQIEFMFVRKGKNTSISELPPNVLNYYPGFVPRIAPKGRWYVRVPTETGHNTLLSAETREGAKKWLAAQSDDDINKKAVTIDQDGDLTYTEQTLELADKLGGLFTSPRKKGDLTFADSNGNVTGRERLSAFEATDRYFAAVAQSASVGELRSSLIGKWRNSVQEAAGDRSIPPLTLDTDLASILPQSPERQALQDMQDWMKVHMGVAGRDERVFEGFYKHVNNIIEDKPFFSENKLGKAVRQGVRDAALAGGNRKLLSLTFDLHLGWFNPAQLFVQASNATLAFSLHPVHGIKSMPRTLAMRASLFMDDIEKFPEFAKALKSFSGESFQDAVKAFEMSGLKDEILRTADYGGMEAGLGKGSLMSYRKLAESGRVMFTEGEMFNRIMTFNIAYEKWLVKNRGRKLSDSADDVRRVVADSRRMMLNMQRENSAAWQNNLAAYPLQFMQVFAKFGENLLPKVLGGTGNWNNKEKLQVLSGQLALYGVGGVPIASQISGYITQAFGVDGDTMLRENPELSQTINEGAMGYITDAMGLGNNFSQRVSLLAGVDDTVPVSLVKALMASVNGTRPEDGLELLFGPTVNTLVRANDGLSRTVNSVMDVYYAPSLESLGDAGLTGLRSIASLTSTGSSAMKYWKMEKMGGMFTRSGEMLMSYPEAQLYSEQELMFHFMGFPLDEVQNYYDSKYNYRPSVTEIRTEAIKDLQMITEQYMLTGNEEAHRARLAALKSMYKNFDWSGITSENHRKIVAGESQMSKEAEARYKLRMTMPGADLRRADQAYQAPQEAR